MKECWPYNTSQVHVNDLGEKDTYQYEALAITAETMWTLKSTTSI